MHLCCARAAAHRVLSVQSILSPRSRRTRRINASAVCSAGRNPFDAAVAAFEALPRDHLQGAVLVCDGTYLATALCRAAGAKGSVTEPVRAQFVDVVSRIRDLVSARAVITVFDSGSRKQPAAGSAEARRARRAAAAQQQQGASPPWWEQRGSPGLLSRAAADAGFVPLVADPWLEADDLAMSAGVRLHHHGQTALLLSGDSDFQHALRPGAAGEGAADQAGSVSWLRVAQFNTALHAVAEVVTWQRFTAENGISPLLYADLLALIGRPRSGVPGVRGVGARAARSLLRRFGPLEAVFAAAEAGKTRGAWVPEVTAALTRAGERERAVRDRDALLPELTAADAAVDALVLGGRERGGHPPPLLAPPPPAGE